MAFENDGKPVPNMAELATRAREIQTEMQHELQELAKKEYNSIVVAGQVKVKMTGNFTVNEVYISPDYLPTHTAQQISDAIALAFNNCKYDIDRERQEIVTRYQQLSNETVMRMLGQNSGKTDTDN